MTDLEVRSKFLGHAIPAVGLDRAIGLDALLWRLHRLPTVESVTSLLSPDAAAYVTT